MRRIVQKHVCPLLRFSAMYLVLTSLLVGLAAVHHVSAQTIVYDDFNDGSFADGSPIGWRLASEIGLANGTFDASTGDLVLTPQTDNDTLLAMGDSLPNMADLSVRVQLRNGVPNPDDFQSIQTTGIILRTDLNSPLQWVEAGIDIRGLV